MLVGYFEWVYTKPVDTVFRVLWLATQTTQLHFSE